MSSILCIDTTLETAFVSVALDGVTIASRVNDLQNSHAGFIHPAIQDLLTETSMGLADVAAVAVTTGPGSYTGIRIGIAAAKGLAFSFNKPVIGIGTLYLMAAALKKKVEKEDRLFCPLIDARRMEVYAAVYDDQLGEISAPANLLLNADSFSALLEKQPMMFAGSGAEKFRQVASHPNARFEPLPSLVDTMGEIAFQHFQNNKFNTAYSILPQYVKAFYEG